MVLFSLQVTLVSVTQPTSYAKAKDSHVGPPHFRGKSESRHWQLLSFISSVQGGWHIALAAPSHLVLQSITQSLVIGQHVYGALHWCVCWHFSQISRDWARTHSKNFFWWINENSFCINMVKTEHDLNSLLFL